MKKQLKITKIAFGDNFKDCLLGNISIDTYISQIKNKYPNIKEDVYQIIANLYILFNNTEASYKYVSSKINLNYFKGIVCLYQEQLIKLDIKIYNLIVDII